MCSLPVGVSPVRIRGLSLMAESYSRRWASNHPHPEGVLRVKDPRYTKLANVLVKHSCKVRRGEKVLIEAYDIPIDFTTELIRTVAEAGGLPVVSTHHQQVLRALFKSATEEQMKFIGK